MRYVFQFSYNKKFLSKFLVTLINYNHFPSSKLSNVTSLNEFWLSLFGFEQLSLTAPLWLFEAKEP